MARHAIVEKLNQEFREPVRSERQAVYILVELRKLLEITCSRMRYRSLDFHCDWAMHSMLDRGGARRIVQRFDERDRLWDEVNRSKPGDPLPDLNTPIAAFEEIVEFRNFRQELRDFCESQQIVGPLLDDEHEWSHFLRQYASVIDSCPLVCNAPDLTYVKMVTLLVTYTPQFVAERRRSDHVMLNWCWKSELTGEHQINQLILEFPWPDAG